MYHLMSGAKELLTTATARQKRLDAQAGSLFAAGQQGAAVREERWRWFNAMAEMYAAFVPGAMVWLEGEMEKVRRFRGRGEGEKSVVDEMVRSCESELNGGKGQTLSKNGAKEAWNIVYASLVRLSDRLESQAVTESAPLATTIKAVSKESEKEQAKGSSWWSFGSSNKPAIEGAVSPTVPDRSNLEKRARARSGWTGGNQKSNDGTALEDAGPADREAQARAAWLRSRSGKD